jgi:hypothetical protein
MQSTYLAGETWSTAMIMNVHDPVTFELNPLGCFFPLQAIDRWRLSTVSTSYFLASSRLYIVHISTSITSLQELVVP